MAVVSGDRGSNHALAYDNDPASYFASGYDNWQYLQIDFQCIGELRGLRRHMTSDGADATGQRGSQGEGVSYSLDGITWTQLTGSTTSGWNTYVNYAPHAWHSLPYGWSAWLSLGAPAVARYVRFHWDGDDDALNEIEVYFAELAGPPEYEITNLDDLLTVSPTSSTANAINNRGAVVGSYYNPTAGENRAVFWDPNLQGHALGYDLEPPCAGICLPRDTYALDVNDHDEAVGYVQPRRVFSIYARHWNPLAARPRPGIRSYSVSNSISNESCIAGYEYDLLIGGSAVAYRLHWDVPDRDGVLVDDSVITTSNGRGVNDLCDVVGSAWEPALQRSTAYIYRGHRDSLLAPEALPLPAGYASSYATAISNTRVVVGVSRVNNSQHHATRWQQSNGQWQMDFLDVSPPSSSAALGVNDLGHVVGHHDAATAVLWRDGDTYDLNQLIPSAAQNDWQLLEARDVNNRGEIVGVGEFQGQRTAFLLTPKRDFELYELSDSKAINNAGWIVGETGTIPARAWLRPVGSPSPISLSDSGSGVFDINDAAIVAGFEATRGAVLWPAPWQPVDLGSPQFGNALSATGNSNAGHAVGFSSRFTQNALLWDERGNMIEPFAFKSYFAAVNSIGHAVGAEVIGTGAALPLRWSERSGLQPMQYSAHSEPLDIDSRGVAVGHSGYSARRWDLAGNMAGLGALETDALNGSVSVAKAINDRRQIVGYHRPGLPGLADHAAFLWAQDAMMDLNLFLPQGTPWRLLSAHDINDAGQILGEGHTPPTSSRRTEYVLGLPNEAEDIIRLCRGWCQPVRDCRSENVWDVRDDIWTRPDYQNFHGCVNGCIDYAMNSGSSRSLADEFAIRDCFLQSEQDLCSASADWEQITQQCCVDLGHGGCNVYYQP
ncbi:MAG: hypothetical protein ACR2RL_18115 [Gammaproteobacteria bacterium]